MLQAGHVAPDFSLFDQAGTRRSLSEARGSWIVLYFYPRDDTPGCTMEACAFRDAMPRFEELDAVVWGVSADDEHAHRSFAAKFDLNFPLLVDPDRSTLSAYGAWVEKSSYGKTHMGVPRLTYLIDPEGKVAKVWPLVNPEEHAAEVAAALAECRS